MMRKGLPLSLLVCAAALALSGCVSMKKYRAMEAQGYQIIGACKQNSEAWYKMEQHNEETIRQQQDLLKTQIVNNEEILAAAREGCKDKGGPAGETDEAVVEEARDAVNRPAVDTSTAPATSGDAEIVEESTRPAVSPGLRP